RSAADAMATSHSDRKPAMHRDIFDLSVDARRIVGRYVDGRVPADLVVDVRPDDEATRVKVEATRRRDRWTVDIVADAVASVVDALREEVEAQCGTDPGLDGSPSSG